MKTANGQVPPNVAELARRISARPHPKKTLDALIKFIKTTPKERVFDEEHHGKNSGCQD